MCCLGCCGIGGICGACIGSFFASCCCSIAGKECSGKTTGPASRIPYILMVFLVLIFTVVMSLYGETQLWGDNLVTSGATLCNTSSCRGNGTVYRISFALFAFFLIHAIVCWFIPSFHWRWRLIKFAIFCIVLAGFFFFGNNFFNGYADFARVASIIFLILQVLVLILWAYDVNDDINEKIDQLQKDQNDQYKLKDESTDQQKPLCGDCCNQLCCFQSALLGGTLFLFALSWILLGLFFQWFTSPDVDCTEHEFYISLTYIMSVIFLILPCLKVFEHASIFVSGIVVLYSTYLVYSAMSSSPDPKCNSVFGVKNTGSLWFGIIITSCALSYLGFSVSRRSKSFEERPKTIQELEVSGNQLDNSDIPDKDDENSEHKKNKIVVLADEAQKGETKTEDDELDEEEKKANVIFHACMSLAAVYIAMLYTNWGTSVSESAVSGRGITAKFVNLVSQWISFILYIMSLIMPIYCKILPTQE